MSEIRRNPIEIKEGSIINDKRVVDSEHVAFNEQHSIADIVRYASSLAGPDEVVYLAQEIISRCSKSDPLAPLEDAQ
tara:strand:- start:1265 stop:1495 length:231 start_codon:yes stop_codon:yes gene_type:complete